MDGTTRLLGCHTNLTDRTAPPLQLPCYEGRGLAWSATRSLACRTAADACADIILDGVLGSDVPAARGANGPHAVLPLSRRAAPTSSTWTAAGPQTAPMGRSRSATTAAVHGREMRAHASTDALAALSSSAVELTHLALESRGLRMPIPMNAAAIPATFIARLRSLDLSGVQVTDTDLRLVAQHCGLLTSLRLGPTARPANAAMIHVARRNRSGVARERSCTGGVGIQLAAAVQSRREL
jgi:hypothetical protein